MTEKTATYFYVSRNVDGGLQTHFCQDELRTSKANDITKRVVGHIVPVLHGETFSLRILVDQRVLRKREERWLHLVYIRQRQYTTEAIYSGSSFSLPKPPFKPLC